MRNRKNMAFFFSEVTHWFCTNCPFSHRHWITITSLELREREEKSRLEDFNLLIPIPALWCWYFCVFSAGPQVVFNPLTLNVRCGELERAYDAPQRTVCSSLPTAPYCGNMCLLHHMMHREGRRPFSPLSWGCFYPFLRIWIQRGTGNFGKVLAKNTGRAQPSLSKAALCVAYLCITCIVMKPPFYREVSVDIWQLW